MPVRSKSKRIFSAEAMAGSTQGTFHIGDKTSVAIQVAIAESCISAASVLDECINITTEALTVTSHGYAEGLKVQLTASIGCAEAVAAACVCVAACVATFTSACQSLTGGESGQFTTSCADLPSGLCVTTNYYAISVTAGTFRVAATRALALSGCSIAITDAGTGTHTFTPNGTIPTGLCVCTDYFVIKDNACTIRLAASRANAIASSPTAINLTAITAPAATVVTKEAADCTSGVVTVRYSASGDACATYLIDAGIGLLDTPGVILAAGLNVIDNAAVPVGYSSVQVDVDVTDSQWDVTIDLIAKD